MEKNTRNSSGFLVQNGGQIRRAQTFHENIKYKTKFTLPSDTKDYHIQVCVICLFHYFYRADFMLLRSEDKGEILSLNWVLRTSVILTLLGMF
mgnify:CR=1 FL=1